MTPPLPACEEFTLSLGSDMDALLGLPDLAMFTGDATHAATARSNLAGAAGQPAMLNADGLALGEAVLPPPNAPQAGMARVSHPSPFAQDTACDEFRMYSFKIDACPKLSEIHDWNECPYLHPGEKARRRDPRVWSYQALPCPEFRKGMCKRGDGCPFAHGVFECWLHPTRYRTTLCKEGGACARPICFFAHSVGQLRDPTPPAPAPGAAPGSPGSVVPAAPCLLSSGTLSLGSVGADSRCGSPDSAAPPTPLPSDNLSAMLVSDGEAAAVAAAVAVRAQQQQAAAAAQAHALVTRLLEMERSTSGSLSLPSVAASREASTDSVDLDGAMGAREAAALRHLMAGLAL